MPFVEFDLDYAVETRGNKINDKAVKTIMYQILLGVHYLHSGNIVHRHLSPATILTNDLQKIYLSGMSYAISIESQPPFPPVKYQHIDCFAPELLFMTSEQQPSHAWKAIDMWAIGAIFSFLLTQESIFQGSNKLDVLESILSIKECSPPNDGSISKFTVLESAFIRVQKNGQYKHLADFFVHNQSASALDLCSKLLQFDPKKRITAEQALHHSYFNSLSKTIPVTCTVGFECTDDDIPAFVSRYCPSVFT